MHDYILQASNWGQFLLNHKQDYCPSPSQKKNGVVECWSPKEHKTNIVTLFGRHRLWLSTFPTGISILETLSVTWIFFHLKKKTYKTIRPECTMYATVGYLNNFWMETEVFFLLTYKDFSISMLLKECYLCLLCLHLDIEHFRQNVTRILRGQNKRWLSAGVKAPENLIQGRATGELLTASINWQTFGWTQTQWFRTEALSPNLCLGRAEEPSWL